jgi:hypothetical protein
MPAPKAELVSDLPKTVSGIRRVELRERERGRRP